MPYSSKAVRKVLKGITWRDFFYVTEEGSEDKEGYRVDDDKGKMNYLYTTQHIVPSWSKKRRYSTIHDFCRDAFDVSDEQAAKICAFLEFYRREGSKYEDEAIERNGDVY